MHEPLVITIDGPAGAGKSTVAQKLAARLGLTYVDSGATYRAAALKVLEAGIDPLDEPAVAKLIGATDVQVTTGDGRTPRAGGRQRRHRAPAHAGSNAGRGAGLALAGSARQADRDAAQLSRAAEAW